MNKIDLFLVENGIDGLLLTDYYNKRYLTGFTGTTGIALATKEEKIFYSDARYTLQATEQVKEYGFTFKDAGKNLIVSSGEDAKRLNVKRLGIDEANINLQEFENIKNNFKDIEFVFVSKKLQKLRRIKTQEEIKKKTAEVYSLPVSFIYSFRFNLCI